MDEHMGDITGNSSWENTANPQDIPQNREASPGAPPPVVRRELITAVFLSIFTFGLYGIWWNVCLHREVSALAKVDKPISGWLVIFLTLITFGAFYLFWIWRMGERCAQIKNSPNGFGWSVGFILCALYGVPVVAWCVMQHTLNEAVEKRMAHEAASSP